MIVLFFKFNVTFSPIGYIVKVRCCLIGRGCQNARRKLPTFERNTCNPCQLRFVSNANVGKHMLNYLKGSRLMNICCILTESNSLVQKNRFNDTSNQGLPILYMYKLSLLYLLILYRSETTYKF